MIKTFKHHLPSIKPTTKSSGNLACEPVTYICRELKEAPSDGRYESDRYCLLKVKPSCNRNCWLLIYKENLKARKNWPQTSERKMWNWS